MELLRRAYDGVQHNWTAVLLYIGITLVPSSARLYIDRLVIGAPGEEETAAGFGWYAVVGDVVTAVILALAQTIVFSRLGRNIDQPMWKVATDRDALRLFFRLWLILDLLNMLAIRLIVTLQEGTGDESAWLTLSLFYFLAATLIIPFGAAVMFHGRFGSEQVHGALNTMGHQFVSLLLIVALQFLAINLILGIQILLPWWAYPTLFIVDGYVDCFVFAFAWVMCMHHRDTYVEPEDDDFDF